MPDNSKLVWKIENGLIIKLNGVSYYFRHLWKRYKNYFNKYQKNVKTCSFYFTLFPCPFIPWVAVTALFFSLRCVAKTGLGLKFNAISWVLNRISVSILFKITLLKTTQFFGEYKILQMIKSTLLIVDCGVIKISPGWGAEIFVTFGMS